LERCTPGHVLKHRFLLSCCSNTLITSAFSIPSFSSAPSALCQHSPSEINELALFVNFMNVLVQRPFARPSLLSGNCVVLRRDKLSSFAAETPKFLTLLALRCALEDGFDNIDVDSSSGAESEHTALKSYVERTVTPLFGREGDLFCVAQHSTSVGN